MRDMGDAYNEAMAAGGVSIEAFVSVGENIDATAADDISGVTGGLLPMSNTDQIADAIYTLEPGLATFEGDGIPTSLSAGMVAPPVETTDYPPETSLWSDVISGADGSISWTFAISFSRQHTSALRLYTSGPSITSGSVLFTAADGTTATEALECSDAYAQVAAAHDYQTVAVTVTGISEPYCHVRIAEVEFGASRALSIADLTGEIVAIDELDPTEKTLPMRELDFTIINIDGTYDIDNPDGMLAKYAVGLPVELSFTVYSDTARWTVPCGRYWIGERSATDSAVDIAAFDGRWFLSQSSATWGLSASVSLGAAIEALLQDLSIPHFIEDDLYDVYPDGEHTFDGETDCLNDLLMIEQAYGIYCLPQRDGTVLVTRTWPAGEAPTVPTSRMLSWPRPKQTDAYNFVSVTWCLTQNSTDSVTMDLRTDPGEVKNTLQIIANRLITSQERATAVLNRIAARVTSQEVELESLGDPAMDTGDSLPIIGRWTQDAPTTYRVRSIEQIWDGMYKQTIRATR